MIFFAGSDPLEFNNIKMKSKPLEQALLTAITAPLREYGFGKPERGISIFRRKTSLGWSAFGIGLIHHKHDFDVTGHVLVRFEELETFVNDFENRLSEKEKKHTVSLAAELGNLRQVGGLKWTIQDELDIPEVAHSIVSVFEETGLPALENYSDAERALELLSRDDNEACLLQPFHEARAMRALGLAFLLDRREDFERIARVKYKFLRIYADDLPRVASFWEFLAAKFEPPATCGNSNG